MRPAFVTALVSGVAVFVNGYGATRFANPTVYTTTKNLVAALLLVAIACVATARRPTAARRLDRRERAGVAVVGVIGGGLPFVLFFEGLASASSTDAAFVHKTLVVWVALMALPLLGERIGVAHVGAVGLLVAGQALLARDPAGIRLGRGEVLVLAATLLWSVEVVVAKRLLRAVAPLRLGAARMGIGVVVLFGWLAATGDAPALARLPAEAWGWAAGTGMLLTAYVATWYSALARARAVDVTAVLVGGALVTALLERVVEGTPLRPDAWGLAVVAAGVTLAAASAARPRAQVVRA